MLEDCTLQTHHLRQPSRPKKAWYRDRALHLREKRLPHLNPGLPSSPALGACTISLFVLASINVRLGAQDPMWH